MYPCFRKKCDLAQTFLHIVQFLINTLDEITDGHNMWSYSCPWRWKVMSGRTESSDVMTPVKYASIHRAEKPVHTVTEDRSSDEVYRTALHNFHSLPCCLYYM